VTSGRVTTLVTAWVSEARNFAELSLPQLILCGAAVHQTTIKHGPRVAQDALECGSIGLANRFGIISSLPRSPHNNIVLAAEPIPDRSLQATAAEEIELFGQRLSQDYQVPASRDDIIVAHYRPCAVPGTISDDIFSQFCEVDFALKVPHSKRHSASF
jgi:hypothetical protein